MAGESSPGDESHVMPPFGHPDAGLAAATMAIWDDAIGSLLTSQGGRRQYGVESRGDLERKLQKWLVET